MQHFWWCRVAGASAQTVSLCISRSARLDRGIVALTQAALADDDSPGRMPRSRPCWLDSLKGAEIVHVCADRPASTS